MRLDQPCQLMRYGHSPEPYNCGELLGPNSRLLPQGMEVSSRSLRSAGPGESHLLRTDVRNVPSTDIVSDRCPANQRPIGHYSRSAALFATLGSFSSRP